jgi:hypothetical protein
MIARSKTVKSIWWVFKFVACYWVLCSVFMFAALSAGIFPEPPDPSPSHLRMAIAQVGSTVIRTLNWPVAHLQLDGSADVVIVVVLPFAYAAVGLLLRNFLRHVTKFKAQQER